MHKASILVAAAGLLLAEPFAGSHARAGEGTVGAPGATPSLVQEPSAASSPPATLRHSLDTSFVSPLFRIWVLQYGNELRPGHEVQLGVGYMNFRYDSGDTHAVSIFAGYRLYVWRGLHLEAQLWPMYDPFWEKHQQRYYHGLDLWAEARVGYRIDFSLGDVHVSMTPQFLVGKGLYASNKPQSFHDDVARESKFLKVFDFKSPMLFTGVRF